MPFPFPFDRTAAVLRWWFTRGAQPTPPADAYDAEVLADSPVIYYKLEDDGTGAVAVDDSGNGNDGTYQGAPSYEEAGPFDGTLSVAFNGTNARLAPDAPYSPNITDFTFECFVKIPNGATPTNATLLSWQENGGVGGGIAVGFGSAPGGLMANGKIWSGWTEPFVVEITGTDAATFNDGNWHHVAAVWDGANGVQFDASQITIYVDGVAVAVIEASFGDKGGTAPYATNQAVFAGTLAAGWDNFVECSMSRIAVYETALSGARIAAHYAASGL